MHLRRPLKSPLAISVVVQLRELALTILHEEIIEMVEEVCLASLLPQYILVETGQTAVIVFASGTKEKNQYLD